jgi:hypothetical protein
MDAGVCSYIPEGREEACGASPPVATWYEKAYPCSGDEPAAITCARHDRAITRALDRLRSQGLGRPYHRSAATLGVHGEEP